MSISGRHVSYGAAVGRIEGPQAPRLHVTLPHGGAQDSGPVPFASWRAARDRTLAAMFAGQDRLVVTGPPGVGKTLLLHDIARILRSAGWDAAVLLRTVSELDDVASTGKPRAILIDEADRLSATELQSIRDTAHHAVLLAGLDSLDGRCPGWARVTLASLTPEECTAFIGLWLAQAGYPSTLLSEDAANRAADLSRGVPRLLANLLKGAVWLAVSDGAALVSKANVEESADFRDCLDVPDKPNEVAAPGSKAVVTGHGLMPIGVNAPRHDLAESIARTRIDPAPAAVPLPPPAWTGPAQWTGQQDPNDDGAQEYGTLMPILDSARNDARQTRRRAFAFAMVGMVCIAAGAVGTGWLFFRPNAAATALPTALRSGPEPVPSASLPAVADAEMAAVTPAPSDPVQLAGLTPTSELRVSGTAWQATGDAADADQRVVPAALNVDALSLGQGGGGGGQYLADLQASASTDPVPGPASPDAASMSASPAQVSELGTIPSVSTRNIEETGASVWSAANSPAPVPRPSEAEPGQEPIAAPEPALPVPAPVSSTPPAVEPAPDTVPAATEPASPPETASSASSSASDEVQRPVVPLGPAEQASGPSQADTAPVAPSIPTSPGPEPEAAPIDAVRPSVLAPAVADGPAPPPAPSLSPATLALLVQRGHQLIAVGDVSGARLLYGRAAASGSGIAALSMGRTFDPAFLQNIGARIAPNAAAATDWYRRAAALGSTDAAALLQQPGGPGLKQIGPKQIRSGQ